MLKEKFKNSGYLAIAFFLPLVLLLLIYAAMEVYPFGKNSVLVLDLNGQYIYFFEALRNILHGEGSFLYSWSRSLGGEFMGIFAYYIASPFSFLVALFPDGMITEALFVIILLKCGSCGLTMGTYLHLTRPSTQYKSMKVIMFSTLYALTAYAVVQSHNTMWIDALILLPLVVLGLEQLIKRGRCLLFIASLAMTVIANFYIGYMVCIFSVIYFLYYFIAFGGENDLISEKRHFIKSVLRAVCSGAVALSIAMVVLYPAYYSLTFGKTTFQSTNFAFFQRFDFLDFIVKLLPGSYDTVRPEGLPFVYCGVLTIILLPFYFISNKIKTREKVMGGVLLTLLILSFNASTIDLVWHGFQLPNWLNYRYSFMFCFMLIVFAYKALDNIESIDYRLVVGISAAFAVLIVIIQKMNYEYLDDLMCIWFSLVCVAAYMLSLHAVKRGYLYEGAFKILIILVCMETFSAGLMNLVALDKDVIYSDRSTYTAFFDRITPIVKEVQAGDDSFYRMEKTVHRRTNDNMTLNIRGLSNSTSTLNTPVIDFLNRMGYASQSHWTKYLGGTPVSDSLLGIKYLVTEGKYECSPYIEQLFYEEEDLAAYLNPYALSIACGVNSAFAEVQFGEFDTPFALMNEIVTQMLGERETVMLFKPVLNIDTYTDNLDEGYTTGHMLYTPINDTKAARIYYNFDAPTNDELFCFLVSDYPREVDIECSGGLQSTFFANETDRITSLGSFNAGETVSLTVKVKGENFYIKKQAHHIYYLDTALFREIMPRLAEGNFNITDYTETHLTGTIDVADDRTLLYTSIPYDEGWHVICDGEELPLIETADALLAAQLTPGVHSLELRYLPQCFTVGLAFTVCGLLSFAALCVVTVITDRRAKKSAASQPADGVNDNEFDFE